MFDWILQHLLIIFPYWIWPLFIGAGATVWFFSNILNKVSFIVSYAAFVRPVSIVVTVFGIFMWGGAGVTQIYQKQISTLEEELLVNQQRSADANKLLAQEQKNKNLIIAQAKIINDNKIQLAKQQIDAECKSDTAVIQILNDAAKNPLGVTK